MHYIIVPESVQLITPIKAEKIGEPRSFIDWTLEAVLNDPRGADGGPVKARRWQKVIEKFEKYSNPGDVITVEDQDFEKLKEIVNSPKVQYGSVIAVQYAVFGEAIIDASKTDPRPKEDAPNGVSEKTEESIAAKAPA